MQDLNDLYYFAAVVDHQGFAAAERALGIPKSRLSRRISQLETDLGVRLLQRSTRRFAVTEVGHSVYRHAQSMLAEAQAAREVVDRLSAEPRGVIRVSVPVGMAQQQMPKLLPEFLALHPGVRVSVDLNDQTVDLVSAGMDLAIRIGALDDSTLVARRLASNRRVLCASPGYLRAHGEPQGPADLARHDCLLLVGAQGRNEVWRLQDGGNEVAVRVQGRLEANQGELLRDAAVAGLGIAVHSTWHINDDLRAGRLRRLRGALLSDVRPAQGPVERLWVARLPVAFRSACFAAWIIAAAGPRVGGGKAELKTEGISIVLAIDVSSSMLAEDFAPFNRLDVAKQTAKIEQREFRLRVF